MFITQVRSLVAQHLQGLLGPVETWIDQAALAPGKMLRTLLARRLLAASPGCIDGEELAACCAGGSWCTRPACATMM